MYRLLENQAEFSAYYVLMQMASRQPLTIGAFLQGLPDAVRTSFQMKRALLILRAYRRGDYCSFFRILKSATTPYLVGCLMHGVFHNAWLKALRILNRSLPRRSGRKLPLADLCTLLCFESVQHADEFCTFAGFTVDPSSSVLLGVPTPPSPHGAFHRYISSIVESKRSAADGSPTSRRTAVIQSGDAHASSASSSPSASSQQLPSTTINPPKAAVKLPVIQQEKPVVPKVNATAKRTLPTPDVSKQEQAPKTDVAITSNEVPAAKKAPVPALFSSLQDDHRESAKPQPVVKVRSMTPVAAKDIALQVLQRQKSMDFTDTQNAAPVSPSQDQRLKEEEEARQAAAAEARRRIQLETLRKQKEAEAKARMERLMWEAEQEQLERARREQEEQRRRREAAAKALEAARNARMEENRVKIQRARLLLWMQQWRRRTVEARTKREEAGRAEQRKRAFQSSMLPLLADGRLCWRGGESLEGNKRVRYKTEREEDVDVEEQLWRPVGAEELVGCVEEGSVWKICWLDVLADVEEESTQWWAYRWLNAKLCLAGRLGEEHGWQQLLRFQVGEESRNRRTVCCHRVWRVEEYIQMQKVHGSHGFVVLLPEEDPPVDGPRTSGKTVAWAERLEEVAREVVTHDEPVPLLLLTYSNKMCSTLAPYERRDLLVAKLGPQTLRKFKVNVVPLQDEVEAQSMTQIEQRNTLNWLISQCSLERFQEWERSCGTQASVEEAIRWCLKALDLTLGEAAFRWRTSIGQRESVSLLTFSNQRLLEGLAWLGNEKPFEQPVKRFTLEGYLTMFTSCVPFLMHGDHEQAKRPWAQAIAEANACISQRNAALKLIIQRLER